jgi:RNA polymerase sigma-70 factor, ECF subfamily
MGSAPDASPRLIDHTGRAAARLQAVPGIEDSLRRLLGAARQAWPALQVDDATFMRRVGEAVAGNPDCAAALSKLHAPDLYFACALTAADSRALAEFERMYLPEVSGYLAQTNPSATVVDDVKQSLREHLFVAKGGSRPRIASYTGRGPLGAWLRMVAIRAARDLFRARGPTVGLDSPLQASASEPEHSKIRATALDPEMSHLKQRYGKEFNQAFHAVLTALPMRERTILRLYFFDAMNITEIGAMYQVHASTVARWLARAKESIFEQTRLLLRQQLKLDSREFESLMTLVQSQLDVSVRTFLAGKP